MAEKKAKTTGLQPAQNQTNFVEMEKKHLENWYKNGVVDKYLHKNDKSKTRFSFIDGPITANNPMGIHHAEARTIKDVVQRYKNMKGFKQRFQNGFDCQGLWVEVEVEKALGFNSKKDISTYGMGNFTDACKARVNKYAGVQTEQSKRLGMFMDWDNSYYTMSETNNLYIWHFLKVCNEKGLLYKNHSATTWCPRCETGLSQHEQSDGYKDIVDKSVYVLFKISGRKNEYILAWTTTPWTLSANVLLAVNPELQYVKADYEDKVIYLAKNAAERLGIEASCDVDVNDLVGLKYDSLYDIPVQKDVKHEVVKWNLVDDVSGTGVVHIAPGCGQEDFELGQELKSDVIAPLDESGHFGEGYGDLSGKYAHDVADQVFEYLTSINALYKVEEYTHSYPHCWRCGTKCLFRLENNWFLNVRKVKDTMKKLADEAIWSPDYAGKRMQNWLDNMGDWMISRKRFYGLSLPFYECKECGKLTVLGSKEELKECAVDPSMIDKLPSLHRPWLDDIKIKCSQCGKEVERVSDVGDCWLDAGVVPFSTLKYLEDKEYWKEWFPADFVTEMIEQVRLWFYSMLVYGAVLEEKVPYKFVLNGIEIRNEKSERMSKSKKNGIDFDEAAEKAGVDAIRWLYSSAPVTQEYMRFGYSILDEVRRQFYLLLWNSYVYFVTYAIQYKWEAPAKLESLTKSQNVLDRWMLSRFASVVENVTKNMDVYQLPASTKEIENFVLDLSTWYIRRSRDRFQQGDKDALNTLYYVLVGLVKVLAPFMPYISEEIYQNLVVNVGAGFAKDSVHLDDFPEVGELKVDENLNSRMDLVRSLCKLGLNVRDENKLKLRQPLSVAILTGVKLEQEYLDILVDELNVKSVECSDTQPKGDNWKTSENKDVKMFVDIELTDELREEGLLRDVVRAIQNERKKSGLKVGESVVVVVSANEDTKKAIENNVDAVKKQVFASAVLFDQSQVESYNDSKVVNVEIK